MAAGLTNIPVSGDRESHRTRNFSSLLPLKLPAKLAAQQLAVLSGGIKVHANGTVKALNFSRDVLALERQ